MPSHVNVALALAAVLALAVDAALPPYPLAPELALAQQYAYAAPGTPCLCCRVLVHYKTLSLTLSPAPLGRQQGPVPQDHLWHCGLFPPVPEQECIQPILWQDH